MAFEKSGTYGWLAIAAGVAAWDLLAPESLTASFKRGSENPRTRPFVIGALGVTAAHLMGVIPRQFDPFYLTIDSTPIGKLALHRPDQNPFPAV